MTTDLHGDQAQGGKAGHPNAPPARAPAASDDALRRAGRLSPDASSVTSAGARGRRVFFFSFADCGSRMGLGLGMEVLRASACLASPIGVGVATCLVDGAASYPSIDSSRSSDGPKGAAESETQGGMREAERAAICVTTFEWRLVGAVGSCLQGARGHRCQMGALRHRARGASTRVGHMTATLEVLVFDGRGVRARRAIFLAARAMASARTCLP